MRLPQMRQIHSNYLLLGLEPPVPVPSESCYRDYLFDDVNFEHVWVWESGLFFHLRCSHSFSIPFIPFFFSFYFLFFPFVFKINVYFWNMNTRKGYSFPVKWIIKISSQFYSVFAYVCVSKVYMLFHNPNSAGCVVQLIIASWPFTNLY